MFCAVRRAFRTWSATIEGMAALALPFPGRKTLGAAQRRLLCAVSEALFDGCSDVSPGRLRADVDAAMSLIGAASARVRWGFSLALWLVQLSPILLGMHWARLERLPVPERVAVLSALERSRWTSLMLPFVGVRTVMMLIFYEHPAELLAIGFAGATRSRHTRHLAVLHAAAAHVPTPIESGVRLRGEGEASADSDAHIEVA